MTSTPTACAICGIAKDAHRDGCGNYTPRQPDTSVSELAAAWAYANCSPETEVDGERGYLAGHARASEEMGAEVYKLKIALDQKEFTLQNTFNQWQERCEQLAAAQVEIERLNVNWNKWNVREAEEALAAAQGEVELRGKQFEEYCERVNDDLAAAELKAGEYEKALDEIKNRPENGPWIKIAREVLTKHKRGGEG